MDTATLLIAVILFAFGFINCFFGYRIFRTLLLLWGFVLGAVAGAALVSGSQPIVILIVAVIAGIFGAVIMRLLYYVGIFVMGAGFGITIGVALMTLLGIQDAGGIGLLVLLAAAILGGLLALAVQKLMLILATSFSGAAGMVNGVLMLVPGAVTFSTTTARSGSASFAVNPAYSTLAVLATVIIGVIGVLVQYRAGRNSN